MARNGAKPKKFNSLGALGVFACQKKIPELPIASEVRIENWQPPKSLRIIFDVIQKSQLDPPLLSCVVHDPNCDPFLRALYIIEGTD